RRSSDLAGSFEDNNLQSYVAKWTGAAWTELGTGTYTSNDNSQISAICSDALGNIYSAGQFSDTNGYMYVNKWNGSTWNELGIGANALNAFDNIVTICSDPSGNIYAA